MNKTDQQIIEIVEPYMNKELVEGCIIELTLNDGGDYGGTSYTFFDKMASKDFTMREYEVQETKYGTLKTDDGTGEILGTLDTTAILKYIQQFRKLDRYEFDVDFFYFDGLNADFCIPNKPYTTYAQEEKEALFKILKKLG